MSTLHVLGDIIAERYRITAMLGEANRSNTYIAEDFVANKFVVIKAISLHNLDDWKTLELLERQAKVLAELDHPAVPRYLAYFHVDTPRDRAFYLVQKFIRGDSLANLIEHGWHTDEAGLKNIALQVLNVLCYLQQQTPAIMHRDIQPRNLLRWRNGRIFLVDFGSVKVSQPAAPALDSTFVGAYGYAPPEQFYGRAYLGSDLYGLGTSLVFVMTGKAPEAELSDAPSFDWQRQAQVSPQFCQWLKKMLERSPKARYQSAAEALAALQGPIMDAAQTSPTPSAQPRGRSRRATQPKASPPSAQPRDKARQMPAGSRVILGHTHGRFVVDVPSGDTHRETISLWDIFGWWHRLEIYPQRFVISKGCLGFQTFYEGQTSDIIKAEVSVELGLWGETKTSLLIWEGVTDHHFAPEITPVEKEWLVDEINYFLDDLRLFKQLQQSL